MPCHDLAFMPASDLSVAIRTKRVSPAEAVDAVLDRIQRLNPRLNAFCTVTAESARREAQAAEAAVVRGDRLGPLHGVPLSVKDLVITRGVRTTFGSWIYETNVPGEDAPLVERLKAAGAILVGKTTLPEFGWKGATDSPLCGITRNPWNLERTPGGSSGGAGAAVAAGLAPLAVGTDGGGSIRIPGSFCGVFGLKPTYGLVPVYPPSPAGTLSHAGSNLGPAFLRRDCRPAQRFSAGMAGAYGPGPGRGRGGGAANQRHRVRQGSLCPRHAHRGGAKVLPAIRPAHYSHAGRAAVRRRAGATAKPSGGLAPGVGRLHLSLQPDGPASGNRSVWSPDSSV